MKTASRIVTPVIKNILRSFCRIDKEGLKEIPFRGPFIVVINHINFLEVPLIYSYLFPREIIGLVKTETWNNPFLRKLANIWEAIPLNRDTLDLNAFRMAFEVLKKRKILILAPEGTRSLSGSLQKGFPGIISIALKSKVPVYPVAHYGGEKIWSNFKSMRRTSIKIKVGSPFYIDSNGDKENSVFREEAVNEVMYRIAALLPCKYRGVYSDLKRSASKYLKYLNTASVN